MQYLIEERLPCPTTTLDTFLSANINLIQPNTTLIIGSRTPGPGPSSGSPRVDSPARCAPIGCVFNNVYAEGYPRLRMTRDDEELLLDVEHQMAYYRRYGDRRFYKGADNVDFLESLAQRRAALILANDLVRHPTSTPTSSRSPVPPATWQSTMP